MLTRLDLSLGGVVWRQLREFWWVYLMAISAMYLTHRLQVELPFIARDLGQLVIDRKMGEIPYTQYLWLALGIIFFRTSSRALFFWPARVLQGLLQEELTMRVEQSPPWRYQSHSSGQIYQCLITDMLNIRGFIGFGLLQVGNVVIAICVLVPRLVDFDQRLLVAFFPLLVCMGLFFIITSYTQQFYRQMIDRQGMCKTLLLKPMREKRPSKTFRQSPLSCNC